MDSVRRLITNPNDLCLIENNVKHLYVSTESLCQLMVMVMATVGFKYFINASEMR